MGGGLDPLLVGGCELPWGSGGAPKSYEPELADAAKRLAGGANLGPPLAIPPLWPPRGAPLGAAIPLPAVANGLPALGGAGFAGT